MKIKKIKFTNGKTYNVNTYSDGEYIIAKEKMALIDTVQEYCDDNNIILNNDQQYIVKLLQQFPAGSGMSFLIELLYNVDKQNQPKWHLSTLAIGSSDLPYVEVKEKENLLESLQQIMSDKAGSEIKLVGVDEGTPELYAMMDNTTALQEQLKQKLSEQVEFLGFQDQDGAMCDYCEGFILFGTNHIFDANGKYWHVKCYNKQKEEKHK